MEIKITGNQLWKLLQIFSWIIFFGLLVEAGAIIVNTVITLFINPDGVRNYWEAKDYLGRLHQFDRSHFIVLTVIMIIVSILKAIMFYLIIKLFSDKNLNLSQPFGAIISRFAVNMSWLSLGIGVFAHGGFKFTRWLTEKGMPPADLQALHIAGADVWLFMAVILFIIVQLVKKGIALQTENDLTI